MSAGTQPAPAAATTPTMPQQQVVVVPGAGTPGQPGVAGAPGQNGVGGVPGQPGAPGAAGAAAASAAGTPGQNGTPGQPGASGPAGPAGAAASAAAISDGSQESTASDAQASAENAGVDSTTPDQAGSDQSTAKPKGWPANIDWLRSLNWLMMFWLPLGLIVLMVIQIDRAFNTVGSSGVAWTAGDVLSVLWRVALAAACIAVAAIPFVKGM